MLGYTTWAEGLKVTSLLEYVTEIGQQLFSYPNVLESELLDFTHFWGGRTSCKRAFLLEHGEFDPRFDSIIEDVELAYRLLPFELRVLYEPKAVSYAARPYSFDEFCARSERRGRGLALFWRIHPAPDVAAYCGIDTALGVWLELRPQLEKLRERIGVLEQRAEESIDVREELMPLYEQAFKAYEAKGLVEGLEAEAPSAHATPSRASNLPSTRPASK